MTSPRTHAGRSRVRRLVAGTLAALTLTGALAIATMGPASAGSNDSPTPPPAPREWIWD